MPPSSTYAWFLQALSVMNAGLDLHRDSLRLKPLLSLADSELDGCNLIAAIVDDLGRSGTVDYVTIRLQQGRFVLVSHARTTPRTDWRVAVSYLIDVARNPRKYLEDPARLDLGWLRKRVGLKALHDSAAESRLSMGASDR